MATNGYSNGSYHGSNTNQYDSGNAPEAVNGAPDEGSSDESSSLDHALLESLFYNEMMMLGSTSSSSSNFFNQQIHEATHTRARNDVPSSAAVDPNTIAETEMLRDFGVASSPLPHHNAHAHHPLSSPGAAALSLHIGLAPSPIVPTYQQPSFTQAHDLARTASSRHHTVHKPPGLTPIAPAPIAPNPVPPTVVSLPPSATPPIPVNSTANSTGNHAAPITQMRAKQLVDQFATLASRLGISLPDNVLQSLTAAAAKNDPATNAQSSDSKSGSQIVRSSLIGGNNGSTSIAPEQEGLLLAIEPTVKELRKTAEEAIAAVTMRKRPSSTDLEESGNDASPSNAAGNTSTKPLYSKRRKKPRLSDCESRLAELRNENDLLKRHLQNVANKANQFNKEKEAAGLRIQRLHEENAGPAEMDKAVQEFSDMYSDYGSHRQQELNFHLEQLKRLVNPTNFTKMGLWTLGQNSLRPNRNPIAGILQKELDITPQQGRKILDQSAKIRALCENLKECISLLLKLKSLCEQKTKIFHDRINKCREILTSKQVVRLILWINEHTLLLESVCPGWGTEHIHPASTSSASTKPVS